MVPIVCLRVGDVCSSLFIWLGRMNVVSDVNSSSGVSPARRGDWTFLTNHAHVLVSIHRDPNLRTRDVAAAVGITERAAQGIIADLVAGGYLIRDRVGRRNTYTVVTSHHLRHPIEAQHLVGDLLAMLDHPSGSLSTRNLIP